MKTSTQPHISGNEVASHSSLYTIKIFTAVKAEEIIFAFITHPSPPWTPMARNGIKLSTAERKIDELERENRSEVKSRVYNAGNRFTFKMENGKHQKSNKSIVKLLSPDM